MASEGAQATLQASADDLAAARLSAQTTLAQSYFSLRTAEAQEALYERSVKSYERFLDMTQARYQSGVAARSDVLQAQTQLRTAQAQLLETRTTRAQLEDTMAMTLGGRAAEELVFSEITTGAANDLEKVTATAKQMTMRFGMSEKLGPRTFGRKDELVFLGREISEQRDYSEKVAQDIDDEVHRLITTWEPHAPAQRRSAV